MEVLYSSIGLSPNSLTTLKAKATQLLRSRSGAFVTQYSCSIMFFVCPKLAFLIRFVIYDESKIDLDVVIQEPV